MNTYLKYQSPAIQFISFLGLASGFLVLNVLLTFFLFKDFSNVFMDKDAVITHQVMQQFKLAQLLSSTIIFVVPALLFGYFSSPKALPYIGLQKRFSPVICMCCIVLILAVSPFINLVGAFNSSINFETIQKNLAPFFNWLGNLTNSKIDLSATQKSLMETEARYETVMNNFLKMKGVGDLVINLFIMALLPAIGEELFFRGALQKSLLRLSNKPWLAILISSIIFALLHGTFFKVLPIFLLSIMLGTMYHYSRNLWYNVIIHFINNAIAVFAVYYSTRSNLIHKLTQENYSWPVLTAAISLAVSVAIIYFIRKKSNELLPAYVTDEDNDYIA